MFGTHLGVKLREGLENNGTTISEAIKVYPVTQMASHIAENLTENDKEALKNLF